MNEIQVLSDSAIFEARRREMVVRQVRERGVTSQRVLDAMATVPRHLFVPPGQVEAAYADEPLPIGEGQTISQPYMVAAMSDALKLTGSERAIEIGTGCGYQSAVLSLLAREVITIEKVPELAYQAGERLARLGFSNVHVAAGDGSLGLPAQEPYEAVLVTAAAPSVPRPLLNGLAEGGRLVIPVGPSGQQELLRISKRDGRIVKESLMSCRFVPLIGQHGWSRNSQESNAG